MIQLKLDTQALNNLFPEGTQARMDLQAAVIKNVVDSVIGKRVTEEIEKIVHKEFADYIQKRYAYSDIFDINSGGIRQIKELITTNVKKQCADLLDSIKLDAINSATTNLKADEEAFIARVTKNLEVTVRQEIVKRVNNEFPQLIDEAIKARLFPEAKG